MSMSRQSPVTAVVAESVEDEHSLYRKLWRMAASQLRSTTSSQTLGATALANETYLKLRKAEWSIGGDVWRNRNLFLSAASEAMRQIIIDYHRRKSRLKRGGGQVRSYIDIDSFPAQERTLDALAIHEALEAFELLHPTKAVLVKLRYFAGMTMPECAAALEISLPTAERHWRYSRAWLVERLREPKVNAGEAAAAVTKPC